MKDIRQQFQSNLFGTIAFTQPFIAHFRTRRSGHIFNVTSIGAATFSPAWGTYCASKVALEAFSDTLAKELSLFGVRVYVLMPGYFPTEIFRKHPAFVADGSANVTRAPASTVYTDRATQGFDSMNWLPRNSEAHGWIGDPQKLSMRVHEIVVGTGLAKEIMDKYAEKGWIRILCGTECGEAVLNKYKDTLENIEAYEPIWRSTDIVQKNQVVRSRL
jgi:NAD(P)-dependent dehydrogenase (short-subunit alcohol dehydrogenase family)